MATGTGNLPYPGKVYNPFDILTAEELNEDVANIESLATGTGLGDLSVPNSAIAGGITGDKLSGGSYSTSEVNTGAKWVDGKDIWKKTINCGAMPNNTGKNVAHGITGLDIVVSQNGMIQDGTTQHTLPVVANSSNTAALRVSFTSTNIILQTNANWSTYTGYVTIWYTKT